MPHVDEGQLHAYLDGALSAMDAVRVERHLADCEPCRARLNDARGLVQRAARLLEWATPPERAIPPLADLQPPVAPRWRAPAAWAATIVIALGIGTYAGYQLLGDGPGRAEGDIAAAPTAPVAPETARTTAAPVRARVDSAAPLRQSRDQAPAEPVAAAERAGADSAPARDLASANEAAKLVDSAKTAVTPMPDVAARREAAAPPSAAAAPRPEPLSLARDPIRAPITTGASTWPMVTRDSAARLLGGPIVTVPDLLVVSVRASGDAVMVEQLVPPGQLIRLVERRAAAPQQEAAGESRAAAPSEALARFVGSLRVEIVGALPADSLSRLLERVR